MTEEPLVDAVLSAARELLASQSTSYSLDELEELVRWDPELFDRALKRAASPKYVRRSGSRGDLRLWIACNLVKAMRLAPWCYFCSRPITRGDFLSADAQVEHFCPISGAGTHDPANITVACASCNELKSDLTTDDLWAIVVDPDAFFARHRRLTKQRRQLEEFAEICLPRIADVAHYLDRHQIESRDFREHWEALKKQYRQKWQTSN